MTKPRWQLFLTDIAAVPVDFLGEGVTEAGRVRWIVSRSTVTFVDVPLTISQPLSAFPSHSTV